MKNRLPKQLVSKNNSVAAFRLIASGLNLDLIDLTNAFRSAARKGELLYYAVDTHWNLQGVRLAANLIKSEVLKIDVSGRLKRCTPTSAY
jgi:hypothetical protein